MLIESVIKGEELRNRQMIEQYEDMLNTLPKGSLIRRKNEYYYLKYRENGKLHDEYIGKNPEMVSKIKKQLELRKHYSKMLLFLKQERKTILKFLEEFK